MKEANALAQGEQNYRELLLAKRAEILSDLRSKLDTLAEPGPAALEDLAPVFHDQFVALQLNRLDFLQLKLIDAALNRMGSEDFGICVGCGDAISHKRLEAIPWAIRCIACEERFSSDGASEQLADLAA